MLDARKAMSSLPALLLGCILAAAAAACMLIYVNKPFEKNIGLHVSVKILLSR